MTQNNIEKLEIESEPSAARCAVAAGSAPMSTDRKLMVAAAGLCIAIFCASAIGIGFYLHPVFGMAMTALCAWWIGSSITDVLKETKDDHAQPNTSIGLTRDNEKI